MFKRNNILCGYGMLFEGNVSVHHEWAIAMNRWGRHLENRYNDFPCPFLFGCKDINQF